MQSEKSSEYERSHQLGTSKGFREEVSLIWTLNDERNWLMRMKAEACMDTKTLWFPFTWAAYGSGAGWC
jgi:hypothetical protein